MWPGDGAVHPVMGQSQLQVSFFWGGGVVCMPQSYLKNRLVHFKALDKVLCRQISTRGTKGGRGGETPPPPIHSSCHSAPAGGPLLE